MSEATKLELTKLEQSLSFYKDESIRLSNLISTAKTSTKKQFYKVKLKKNNNILAKYLIVHDALLQMIENDKPSDTG